MKSEPGEFSIDDLQRKKRHHWDGVRGFEARNFMRDSMKIGDQVIFYHSNGDPSGPAGIAKVCSSPYPDFTQWDKKSKYYNKKASKEKPIWIMIDLKFVEKFLDIIPRDLLKEVPALQNMLLWKKLRLSIIPLTEKEFTTIAILGKKSKKKII
jgi:predicted RNA-binding protein with PUA-like domain